MLRRMVLARASGSVSIVLLSSLALGLSACGAAGASFSRTTPLADRGVNRDSFDDVRREYLVLSPEDPDRVVVRDRLLAYLDDGADALIRAGDYDAVVARLADMTELLAPIDLAAGAHPPSLLSPLAHFVAERGAPRGDEPRVLAALLLLSRIEPEDVAHSEEYARAALWGHDARVGGESERRSMYDSLEGGMGLVEVWEEHARLSPAPEVLDRLASLHLELRERLSTRGELSFAPPRSMAELEAMSFVSAVIERAPLEVAAVYLRVGDLTLARARVGEMGDESGTEWRVRRILDDAQRNDDAGIEALLQLAVGFAEVRPDVSIAVCRNGRRRFPTRPDFPLCLARLRVDHPGEATSWYAEAVRLAPDDREVYDEALERIPLMIDQGVADPEGDIGAFRMLASDTEWILNERTTRWPSEPPTLTVAALRRVLGDAEANAGNVEEARRALESSIGLERSSGALGDLGRLELATSNATRATSLFEEALASLTDQSRAGRGERASLYRDLADAQRLGGDAAAATRTYRQALDTYRTMVDDPDNTVADLAVLHARIGVVARRLGDRSGSDTELRAGMRAAPAAPDPLVEPFIEALVALVIDQPDPTLAAEAFHGARVGSALDPAWKVYLALWAQLASERAGATPDPEILDVLLEHSEREGWHGRLAALGAGTATMDEVLAAATSEGERCEANFYGGARLLALGDRAGAERSFRAAVETGMVRYFEYRMALELLVAP